ncbi:MAG TPA: hypothetical protein VGM37_09120 [Armatimonadota bacterium]
MLRSRVYDILQFPEHDDGILLCEQDAPVDLAFPTSPRRLCVRRFAVSAGHGRSVLRMDSFPFRVSVMIARTDRPEALSDLEGISRGTVYNALPEGCLESLGYVEH